MNKLDRADIDAARRLRDEQKFRIELKLTSDDQLLLVAARKRFCWQTCHRRANVKVFDDLIYTSVDRAGIHKSASLGDRRTVVNAEYRVFRKVRGQQKSTFVPVLGNVCD